MTEQHTPRDPYAGTAPEVAPAGARHADSALVDMPGDGSPIARSQYHVRRGELDKAISVLDAAIQQDGDARDVLFERARLLAARLRYEPAAADLRRLLRGDDGNAELLTLLGSVLMRNERLRDAIEPLRRAVESDPQRAEAHYYLGETHNRLNEHVKALASYESAVALDPQHWRALKGMGNVLDKMGRAKDAASAHRRAGDVQRR